MPLAEMNRSIYYVTASTSKNLAECHVAENVSLELGDRNLFYNQEVLAQVSKIINCMVLGGEFYLGNPDDQILAVILMQQVKVLETFENLHKITAQAQFHEYLKSYAANIYPAKDRYAVEQEVFKSESHQLLVSASTPTNHFAYRVVTQTSQNDSS